MYRLGENGTDNSGGKIDGYYSSNGKRVERNDRCGYDGLQEGSERDGRRHGCSGRVSEKERSGEGGEEGRKNRG